MKSAATTENYRTEAAALTFTFTEKWAKKIVLNMLKSLQYGRITVQEGTERWNFGSDTTIEAHVTIHHPSFYRKTLFGGSVGAGEAYVDRLWDVDNLTRLCQIMVKNMELLDGMEQGFALLLEPLRFLRHVGKSNSRKGAKKNMISHYDLGNEMYKSFLDPSMMYSSAIYESPGCSLEQATVHKLEEVCRKLDLKPSDHVMEIGSGWGGFAIHAASTYGCHVTTTTISDAQYHEAERRIVAAGLEKKITLLRRDYRDLTGQYDKLVSIEMIEAVGHHFHPHFFKKCSELLKNNGMMLLQAITIADQKYQQYIKTADFIQRHIFPGGCLPSNQRMLQLIGEKTDMVVRRLDDFGYDYAKTLQEWRNRFDTNFASLKKYGYDERFRRLWNFYFSYCEGGFLERSISVVHLVATKPLSTIAIR